MANLTTLSDVKTWLGLTTTTDDTLLSRLITAASDFITNWLSFDITQTTYTETYHGNGNSWLVLRNDPVTAVSSVVITDPSSGSSTTYDGTYFTIGGRNIYFKSGYVFQSGMGNVVVSYTAGYAIVPLSLAQACIELVALRYREKDRIGQMSVGMGGTTTSFVVKDMPDSVRTILMQFRNTIPN